MREDATMHQTAAPTPIDHTPATPVAYWSADQETDAPVRRLMEGKPSTFIRFNSQGYCQTAEGLRVVCIDTETGGLQPKLHALMSVAAQAVTSRLARTTTIYITPARGLDVTERAVEVNGLTKAVLKERGAVDERVAMQRLGETLTAIGDGKPVAVVAHRASFDVDFLHAAAQRCHATLPIAQVLDTHPTCKHLRSLWPDRQAAGTGNTLDALRRLILGDQAERGVHTAEEDCQILASCVRVMARRQWPVSQRPMA